VSATERAYAAADAWRALADAAHDASAEARGAADALIANNSGAAVDAFAQRWREVADPGCGGSLPRLARACTLLAERCENYAAHLATGAY
jgi:hypothetical protein